MDKCVKEREMIIHGGETKSGGIAKLKKITL